MLDMDSIGDPLKSCFLMSWNEISKKKLKKKCFVFANFGLKVTRQGFKVGKNEKNYFNLTIVQFILKLIGMMHWFQNCLQNKNPSHRTQEITKNVFSPFPVNREFSEGRVWLRKYGLIYMTIAKKVTLRPPDHMEVIFY